MGNDLKQNFDAAKKEITDAVQAVGQRVTDAPNAFTQKINDLEAKIGTPDADTQAVLDDVQNSIGDLHTLAGALNKIAVTGTAPVDNPNTGADTSATTTDSGAAAGTDPGDEHTDTSGATASGDVTVPVPSASEDAAVPSN